VSAIPRLNREAVEMLQLGAAERIEKILNIKSEWIPYPAANQILRKLDDLKNRPKTHRMSNLLIWGDTNMGKSRIVKRYCDLNPIDSNPGGDATHAPVIAVEVMGPDIGQLYNEILRSIGAVFRVADRAEKKQFQTMKLLQTVGTQILFVDEINTAIAGPELKQRRFLNVLKYFGNQLGLTICGVGTKEALSALRADPQLDNRFERAELKRWAFGDDFRRLVASFERILPLRQTSMLQEPSLAMKLFSMSEGYIGELAEVLIRAGVAAVMDGSERIDARLLDKIGWVGPTDRQKRF